MSKIEINKEIVLMRKNVEQAKIHIIKKHTREAMKLRKKKGTDAQKAKNTRKADRIGAEILAMKKVKPDEVTKRILTETLNLKEILNNTESEPLTRMIARIANHKIYSKKIAEFKEKYPNYMEFLGPGRKKKAIQEWKEKKKLKKQEAEEEEADESLENENSEESSADENSEGEDESDAEESDEVDVNNTGDLESKDDESEEEEDEEEKVPVNDVKNEVKKAKKVLEDVEKIETPVKKNKKVSEETAKTETPVKKAKKISEEAEKTETTEISKPEKPQKRKKEASETKEDAPSSKKLKKKKKTDIPKVISKQAVVKKFTDILNEDESNVDKEEIDNEPTEPRIQVEKEEDPFFVTSDGQSNYLSVAPVRNKSDNQKNNYENGDDDEDNDNYRGNRFNNNKNKFQRQDPDKYFSNVSKFKHGNNNNNNFKKAGDGRWDAPNRNGRAYNDKEKPGRNAKFSKFNDESRDKSKQPFSNRQSKGGIETSTSNEILHPSWEAKKKQQEALKKGFQGKKIVFGDDDV